MTEFLLLVLALFIGAGALVGGLILLAVRFGYLRGSDD